MKLGKREKKTLDTLSFSPKISGTAFPPRENNLEWLRLIFAIQVVLGHAAEHLNLKIPAFIRHFPGVPAFFFVSGFLIYASYLNAPGRRYIENRFLRLYPALAFVTLGGIAVALVAHGWRDLIVHFSTFTVWFLSQTTLGQAYNPALFRDIGVGVINGSLWTLTTEILFYCSVPLIVWMERKFRFTLPMLLLLSFAVYLFGPRLGHQVVYRGRTVYDVVALTPIVWGWMFGFGILGFKHFGMLQRSLKYLVIAVVPLALMVYAGKDGPFLSTATNRLGLLYFISYVAMVLWFAFATPFVRLKFDLSYGIYVWHMPVINLVLVLGVPNFLLAIGLTGGISAISWLLVEKPALTLKRASLKPVDGTGISRQPAEEIALAVAK